MTTPSNAIPPVASPPQPPMPPQGYPPYGMPPYPVQLPTNTSAILSLIFSIAGFVIIPIIGGIVGVILGNIAKKEIANRAVVL